METKEELESTVRKLTVKLDYSRQCIRELQTRLKEDDGWPKHVKCIDQDAGQCYACGLEALIDTVMSNA